MAITGTDGVSPVYDESNKWAIWGLHEIYNGGVGTNRYVPKLGDYVIDKDLYITYRVDAVDPVTYLSTLTQVRPYGSSFTLDADDVLFGVGPGTDADTYRAYYDASVIPHVLTVDQRLKIGGTGTSYAKLFKGSDTTATGHIVGMMFDNSGNYLTDQIPLELAALDSITNHAIKTIKPCYTTEPMTNGERITAVLYSPAGHVVSKRQLLLEETTFIRSGTSSTKYITHISLATPFLSQTNDATIEVPINVPVTSLNLMGIVHYNDGTQVTLPVDGTKFKIFGLDQYVSTVVGQQIDLVLTYSVGVNEQAIGGNVTLGGTYVTEPYKLVTVAVQGSYSVKLFGYPYWVSSAIGYRMKWMLYNLDRNVVFDVTPYVYFNASNGPFDPKLYGFLQRLSVRVNLADVSGTFTPFIHTQSIDIFLKAPMDPSTQQDLWTVGLNVGLGNQMYGTGLFMKATSTGGTNWTIKLDSNQTVFDTWLTKVYKETYPLVNPVTETVAPDPTHFIVEVGGLSHEFTIDKWNSNNAITNPNIIEGDTAIIKFIRRVPSNDIQLAAAGLSIVI